MLDGSAVLIVFERNGEIHQTYRWTTDQELLNQAINKGRYADEIRQGYREMGANVLSISRMSTLTAEIS